MTKKQISKKISRSSKKIKSINYLGGKCLVCGEENHFKLTFHHKNKDEKEFEYNSKCEFRWSILKNELDKCVVLCQNCHRELHYRDNIKYGHDFRNDKLIYLEYSGGKCVKCEYSKCPSSLSFHHRNSMEKNFWIGGLNERINSIEELSNKIREEIDKCDLLCANCHVLEHSDIEFFEKNKLEIYKKIDNYKEKQSKLDHNLVIEMYKKGIKQMEISKYFKASKGTISGIIKNYKLYGK